MAYIEVDVDLNEIEPHDLVQELCSRLQSLSRRKAISETDKASMCADLKALLPLYVKLGISAEIGDSNIQMNTLDDKMKLAHLDKVWAKYTWADLSKLLPE